MGRPLLGTLHGPPGGFNMGVRHTKTGNAADKFLDSISGGVATQGGANPFTPVDLEGDFFLTTIAIVKRTRQ
jgi:hypothetical protein